MKKIILIGLLFLGLFSGFALVQTTRHKLLRDSLRPVQFAPTQQTTEILPTSIPVEEDFSAPVYLTISKLELEKISVEQVGLDSQQRMDVPKNSGNVAWFKLGYLPGKKGNSVIAGHYDKKDGTPAVFYNLNNLGVGDEVKLGTVDGKEKIFIVQDKKLFPNDSFPVQEVFGKSKEKMLNLITCDGTWDRAKKSYTDRLVIFSRLKE